MSLTSRTWQSKWSNNKDNKPKLMIGPQNIYPKQGVSHNGHYSRYIEYGRLITQANDRVKGRYLFLWIQNRRNLWRRLIRPREREILESRLSYKYRPSRSSQTHSILRSHFPLHSQLLSRIPRTHRTLCIQPYVRCRRSWPNKLPPPSSLATLNSLMPSPPSECSESPAISITYKLFPSY